MGATKAQKNPAKGRRGNGKRTNRPAASQPGARTLAQKRAKKKKPAPWKPQGFVRDALGRRQRAERVVIETLKRGRQPMREMGEHPAGRALGELVREFCERSGLSHKGLAELTHLSRPTVSRLEEEAKGVTFNSFAWTVWGMGVTFEAIGRYIDRRLGLGPRRKR